MAGLVPAIHGKRGASVVQVEVEVSPVRIHGEDQANFPRARPRLHVALAVDRRCDVLVELVPHQPCQLVSFGESAAESFAMFIGPASDISSDASVKRTAG